MITFLIPICILHSNLKEFSSATSTFDPLIVPVTYLVENILLGACIFQSSPNCALTWRHFVAINYCHINISDIDKLKRYLCALMLSKFLLYVSISCWTHQFIHLNSVSYSSEIFGLHSISICCYPTMWISTMNFR